MNPQEIYERQRVYFTQPGAQYGYAFNSCVYYSEVDGKQVKCAVGCLLPDEFLDNEEFQLYGGIDVLLTNNPDLVGKMGWGIAAVDFLRSAQTLHDNSAMNETPLELFVERLDNLARREGLDVARAKALCTPACPED